MKITFLVVCLISIFFISCETISSKNLSQIQSPRVFTINAPAAGNYPQGLYRYPYKTGAAEIELFTQTLEWSPAAPKTFATNTQYTAQLTLNPVSRQNTFAGTQITDVIGLPKDRVKNISLENKGRSLVIQIVFEPTGNANVNPQIIFHDDFNGISLDKNKWELCPEWDRQGRSSWRDDMVSVSGGMLRLKFRRDSSLGASKSGNKTLADNWIRAGGIRTLNKNYFPLFENSYGYYEARIKFPVVSGTWGAFWLMSRTQIVSSEEGKIGTEIDIVETINNHEGKYNAALHWNGYGSRHKSVGSDSENKPAINIFDGEFHIFALDWSPSEYIFYVDGEVFWRVEGGAKFLNSNINQNPNYIKLTVESAPWAGNIPQDFSEGEMLVDYVRVYNQPRK